MSLTFAEAWNELKGDIEGLSPFRAQRCVQRAWRDIQDARRWSFLVAEGVLTAVDQINAGTVTVSQYSTSVVGDAAAEAAWNLLVAPASGVPITQRQFRLAGKPVYNITKYTASTAGPPPAPATLTLDRKYQEASEAAVGYVIYRCYFSPPSADFLSWVSIRNPVGGYQFRRRNLHRTKHELDRRDPYRTATGLPFWVVPYKADPSGNPLYELWPHPTAAVGYLCAHSRRGTDLAEAETVPAAIPDELLMSRARFHAYAWAIANSGRFAELANINWHLLRRQEEDTYKALIQSAKVRDEEIFLMNWSESEDEPALIGPVSASWLQSHDSWYA